MKAPLGAVVLLACAVQWPRGILAAGECELRGAAKCFKNLFDVMNDNMPHLAQEEDSALDGQIDILIGHLPAQPDCFGPSEQCATAAEKEYFARARLNYEKFRPRNSCTRVPSNELIRAFKCYDGERFKTCVSKIILNFFSVPLKTSKADIKNAPRERCGSSGHSTTYTRQRKTEAQRRRCLRETADTREKNIWLFEDNDRGTVGGDRGELWWLRLKPPTPGSTRPIPRAPTVCGPLRGWNSRRSPGQNPPHETL
uniref:Putative secreted protein n=1 Tax=Ixodes ricinus TaxID=34613 RepID=A0A090X9C5_IXORI